jgi:hypothetical protein
MTIQIHKTRNKWRMKSYPVKNTFNSTLVQQCLIIPTFLYFGMALWLFAGWLNLLPVEFSIDFLSYTIIATGITFFLALHEIIHWLAMRSIGITNAYFGINWNQWVAYVFAPGAVYTRWRCLYVTLAPFVLISCFGIIFMLLFSRSSVCILMIIWVASNAATSIFDFCDTVELLCFPKGAYILSGIEVNRVIYLEK